MNDKHNLKHTGQTVPHLYSFLHGGFVLVTLGNLRFSVANMQSFSSHVYNSCTDPGARRLFPASDYFSTGAVGH